MIGQVTNEKNPDSFVSNLYRLITITQLAEMSVTNSNSVKNCSHWDDHTIPKQHRRGFIVKEIWDIHCPSKSRQRGRGLSNLSMPYLYVVTVCSETFYVMP